jgi:hypothetical protein
VKTTVVGFVTIDVQPAMASRHLFREPPPNELQCVRSFYGSSTNARFVNCRTLEAVDKPQNDSWVCVGFVVRYRNLTDGVAAMHSGWKL